MPKVRKKSEGVLNMQIQMARSATHTRKLSRLAATTALVSLLPIMAMAQSGSNADKPSAGVGVHLAISSCATDMTVTT